jgi:hypothetical protein
MTDNDTHGSSDDLQFDRVVANDASAESAGGTPGVVCVVCKKPLLTDYFLINGKTVCDSCRAAVLSSTAVPKGLAPMGKSIGLGLLAAIAGAAVYYGVIRITNFEIGIVAILIGYMVGWAVRKGANGRGGRRFQILAVALTYWAVGLAYAPLVYEGTMRHSEKPAVSVQGSVSDSTSTATAVGGSKSVGSRLVALGTLFFLSFALPVITIFQSMPGGILSAFIIFIGLRQAWQMTAAPVMKLSGPYRVGSGPSTASA